MNSKVLAFLGVALAAVLAAGTGAFFALRQGVPAPASTVSEPATATADSEASNLPAGAVAETEAVLAPDEQVTAPPSGSPPAAATPAPRRSSEPAARGANPERATRPTPTPTPRQARTEPRETAPAEGSVRPDFRRDPVPESLPSATVAPPAPEPARPEPEATPAPPPLPPMPPPPPEPQFEEVTLPADSVIGLQIETNVSSETAKIEDRVEARVTRDVRSKGLVAVPAGSKAQGSVTLVEKGGKIKERARLGVRFHTLVLADGTRVPIQTETVLREGDSPKGESATKIGGAAVGGAIIGAILGGGKGAAIGGAAGAAGGTAAAMAGGRNPATLAAGSSVTVRLSSPTTVTVEK